MTKTMKASSEIDAVKKMLPLEARCIQCIQDFNAPRTTQDAIDQLAAEYATANYLRQQAEKRYNDAKREIVDMHETQIVALRNEATQNMQKEVTTISGEDWSLQLAANKPATKVDAYDLRTELIKQGIKVEIIDRAIIKVTKKTTPALVITAARLVE